jgi:hypothetical protein
LHSYLRAGFSCHPAARVKGIARDSQMPRAIRPASGSPAELEFVDQLDQTLRGASRRQDLAFWLDIGGRLLLDDEGGYAIVNGTRLTTLAAVDLGVARGLLTAVLTGAFGHEPADLGWVTARHQWVFETAVDLGAELSIYGAVMARGDSALAPYYLPNPLLG